MAESKLAMLAGGGHARVLLDTLESMGHHVSVVLDPFIAIGQHIYGVPVVGDENWLMGTSTSEFMLVNGVGSQPRSMLRKNVYDHAKQHGFTFATVVHSTTVIGREVILLEGAQVMAGTILQCSTRIGINTLINTGARIDHDCEVGDHAFIGPGTILCGGVRVEKQAYIGAGAVVLPGIVIGAGSIVGAGAIVTRDVEKGTLMMGNPAVKRGCV
ncbi:acetyltransferase [Chromobacterium haemolyticum]|nr:acetyltransferase [Chromobacterium haemolyticum]